VLHASSDTLLSGSQARLVLPLPGSANESNAPLLCLPLRTAELVGLLCLLGDAVDTAWSAERRALARSLAAQITLAVQEARLTHALALEREQFDVLARLAAELPLETELEPALARTLRTIAALAGAEHGTLLLLDRDEQVALRVALNHDNLVPLQLVARSVIRNGLAGWALRERRSAIIADTSSDTRWVPVPGLGEMRSALVVPLLHGERALGVLTLANDRPDHFTQRHLLLASAIAAQALHRLVLADTSPLRPRPHDLQRHLAPATIEALERADTIEQLATPHTAPAVVLVLQLSGWPAISERLAPAVLLDEVLRPFAKACAEVIYEQGGYLSRCDGALTIAAFGYPLSTPDAATRALAAAIKLRQSLDPLRRSWRTTTGSEIAPVLAVGNGEITAGRVGEGATAEYVLLGPAVGQAQRLLALARPGEVLCSAGVAAAYAHERGNNGAYTLVPLQPLSGAPADERPFRVAETADRMMRDAQRDTALLSMLNSHTEAN
jgi:GAF domain-containing protein/class 3 adenylate cyclase